MKCMDESETVVRMNIVIDDKLMEATLKAAGLKTRGCKSKACKHCCG